MVFSFLSVLRRFLLRSPVRSFFRLFAGQLGQGEAESGEGGASRYVHTPTVVSKFRDSKVLQVSCGSCHTLVVASSEANAIGIFAMGLNRLVLYDCMEQCR